jgi:hypothetical protein
LHGHAHVHLYGYVDVYDNVDADVYPFPASPNDLVRARACMYLRSDTAMQRGFENEK